MATQNWKQGEKSGSDAFKIKCKCKQYMNKILLLDTSVGSGNKGDDIIMECCRKELGQF